MINDMGQSTDMSDDVMTCCRADDNIDAVLLVSVDDEASVITNRSLLDAVTAGALGPLKPAQPLIGTI